MPDKIVRYHIRQKGTVHLNVGGDSIGSKELYPVSKEMPGQRSHDPRQARNEPVNPFSRSLCMFVFAHVSVSDSVAATVCLSTHIPFPPA